MAETNIQSIVDIPGVRQISLLAAIAAAVAIGVTVFMWSQTPSYQPVFTNLADKDASQVTEALKSMGVDYSIDPASGLITVPADRVHEARMMLASQGLPQGTSMGFEVMNQDQGFGVSQFLESARYQHALETELVRTITNLRPVRQARVHLAIPKPSAFARERSGPSASVFVELFPGRMLESAQVSSIVHLVASSIPEMHAEDITVIDQNGRLLTVPDPNGDAAVTDRQFKHIQRIEQSLIQRINELLLPMTGPGRISTQVAVDMDFTRTEETRESYRPDPAAVRSEQLTEESSTGAMGGGGIPGAVSNKPVGESADAGGDQASGSALRKTTRNYEMDRSVSYTKQPTGRVRRLSVAVLVDYLPSASGDQSGDLVPMSADQLQRVEALVREAVGFDSARGDTVSVMNAPFRRPEPIIPETIPIWEQPAMREIARQLIGALVVLVIGFAVLRPVLKRLVQLPPPAQRNLGVAVSGGGAAALSHLQDDRASLSGPSSGARAPQNETPALDVVPYEQKLAMAKSVVGQDPKRVAQVVRSWVDSDG